MAKFSQGDTNRDDLLVVEEGGADFGFGDQGHDTSHDFGYREDGFIESGVGSGWQEGIWGTITKRVGATHTTTGPWF